MTSKEDIHSDEYIAKLLAEDARKSSIKYSSEGLSALLPKRPTNSAAKPNTRFLQSILRETDSHNAALKRREEVEARTRLQNMRVGKLSGREAEGGWRRKRRRDDEEGHEESADHPTPRSRRSRRSREGGDSKRRRRRSRSHSRERHHVYNSRGDESSNCDKYRARKTRDRSLSRTVSHVRGRPSSQQEEEEEDRRHRRRRHSTTDSSSPEHHHHHHHHHHRSRRRKGETRRQRPKSHPRPVSSTPSPSRETFSPATDDQRVRTSRLDDRGSRKRPSSTPTPSSSSSSSSSSDPLEDIVGPLPPPRRQPSGNIKEPPPLTSRGRGSHRPSSSAIDNHFSTGYDPALDLPTTPSSPPTDEREDWDMALEALRDREIWRKKGAERLRQAGFDDDEVRRWEESASASASADANANANANGNANAREKGPDDVRWRPRGEEREWDAGKMPAVRPRGGSEG